MNCVILQPSYIPWRGYFHQIQKADVFVFLDDVQYDTGGWRNRNRIKSPTGSTWLTVPVHTKGVHREHLSIRQIRIVQDHPWRQKHWAALEASYRHAPYFERYRRLLEPLWLGCSEWLADLAVETTQALAAELGVGSTRFVRSSELGASGAKTERLLALLQGVGARHYISGPSARAYLDEALLARHGIDTEYMVYDYPEYEQLHPPYDPQVSVLDLLFMKGPEAGRWIWGEPPKP